MEGFRLEGSTKRTPAGTGWGGAAGLHMLVVGAAMDRLIKPFCGGKKNMLKIWKMLAGHQRGANSQLLRLLMC